MTHHDKLARKYREVDWVSEYQRIWAYFDEWLRGEYPLLDTQRKRIEAFKKGSPYEPWLRGRIQKDTADGLIENSWAAVAAFIGRDGLVPQFARNWFRVYPGLVIPRKRGSYRLSLVTLELNAVEKLYWAVEDWLASEEGVAESISFFQLLSQWGIGVAGDCFYKVNGQPSKDMPGRLADVIQSEASLQPLNQIVNGSASYVADVAEMLYTLRNDAVHGDLDFLNPNQNDLARAGFELMVDLIKFVLAKHGIFIV